MAVVRVGVAKLEINLGRFKRQPCQLGEYISRFLLTERTLVTLGILIGVRIWKSIRTFWSRFQIHCSIDPP